MWLPGSAQLSLVPQLNTGLPVGNIREYGTPRVGYGAEAGYQFAYRWDATVAYDLYLFELSAGLDDLNINATLAALLNLPETFTLDLTVDAWRGGLRYSVPFPRFIPFAGIAASTNLITVRGYGLSISRRYWGISPILGLEWLMAPRWSVQTEAHLQTIFIRDQIPFVAEIIEEYLVYIPIHMGVRFQLATRRQQQTKR